MSLVLRMRDASGAEWYLKRHRDRARYYAELNAYHAWVPALRGRGPQLRAFDESLQAMILSAVPGEHARWPAGHASEPSAERAEEAATQRQAGMILRRFHDAQPPLRWPDFGMAKLEHFEDLRPALRRLLTPRELDAARREVVALADVPAPRRLPCHHDYTPRNWLVAGGSVHVIDFEWAYLDVWVADLARLQLSVWPARPDLREAFLAGYCRELSAADHKALRGCAVLTGVWLMSKAHETGQPSFENASRTAVLRLMDSPA